MNKKQRLTLAGALLIALSALGTWAATGFHILTKQQIPVEEVDELFGTKTIVWQDVFIAGLDITGPIAAGAIVLGAVLVYLFRNRKS